MRVEVSYKMAGVTRKQRRMDMRANQGELGLTCFDTVSRHRLHILPFVELSVQGVHPLHIL